MNTKHSSVAEQHAAKRHWLNSQESGYHKAMGNRQVQMIAIGGAIGTGLFLGAGARLQMAGPALALVYLVCGLFSFFILRALGELVLHRPSSGSFVSYAREFLGEKAAYVAGWMYFVNWAMTGIVDITAVALYMHYWGAFGDVPQWVFALGALAIVGTMNMIGVKWFAEMEFWFALVKVLAIVAFLVVGTIFLGSGKPLDGNTTGFHLITDNGGLFPHGLLPALVLVQGVVFAFASIELVGTAAGECKDPQTMVPRAINSVIWRIGLFYVGSVLLLVLLLPWNAYQAGQSPFRHLLLEAGRAVYRKRDEYCGVNRRALQPQLRSLLHRAYSALHVDGRFRAEVYVENEPSSRALRRDSGDAWRLRRWGVPQLSGAFTGV
ncbi:L-asparagine permease [Klebsiella grimontii]|uniref:L-asparagine permease n=1 Tax=Klebsiella grimontii TaxID=2058152 RepID=A0A7H4P499_9ENTR|nr:L-asparagine permease [Klebsiella grimontii]